MRILHLISSRGFYGAENVVYQLCRALKEAGDEVSIALFNAHRLPENPLVTRAAESGIDLVNLHCAGRVQFRAVQRLRALLRERRIEVLHTHNYKSNAYGYLASRGLGVTTVATCHNWTDTTMALRVYGSLDRMLLSRFDRVVAVSAPTAERLRKAHLPSEMLSVISNGVVVPELPMRNRQQEKLVVGVVARLSPEKGVHVFLEAAAEVLRAGVRARFVIAGDGPERERLTAMSRELGIAEHVEFLGFVSDIPALLGTLDIFVQPSLVDAMPMSVLEAMAVGLPVVASAIGGIPGLLGETERGLLAPAGDHQALARSVLTLSESAAQRGALGQAAREHILRHCSAAAMARQYEELYRSARQVPVTEAFRAAV